MLRKKKPCKGKTASLCRILQGIRLQALMDDGANIPAYGLPKETVAAIMMLYKSTKVKDYSSDEETDNFDIVACVLQEDTLASYQLNFCLNYVLRTSVNLIKKTA